LSTDDLSALLPAFYLGLDFHARRARFGCAVSDDSILCHCRGLNLDQAIVLGCVTATGLMAAVELHPTSSSWENAELALADSATTDRGLILDRILQLAAFTAGKRDCNTLVVQLGPSEHDLLGPLRRMGRVRVQDDSARIDLGDHASRISIAPNRDHQWSIDDADGISGKRRKAGFAFVDSGSARATRD
jgi:hypothetical protein